MTLEAMWEYSHNRPKRTCIKYVLSLELLRHESCETGEICFMHLCLHRTFLKVMEEKEKRRTVLQTNVRSK